MPRLRRWARGRLPGWARGALDTDDLVQETVLSAIRRLDSFEPQHEGALQAYLRQALLHRIHDEIRRVRRRPAPAELSEDQPDRGVSPLEEAVGHETLERYEAAMAHLRDDERALVLMRVELHASYQEIADATGRASPDAARMAVGRALVRLAQEMGHDR